MNTLFRALTVLFSLISLSSRAGISIVPSVANTFFNEEGAGPFTAVVVDPQLTVTGDASTVTGVSVTMVPDAAAILGFINDGVTMGNITGSFNAATGTLSLASAGSAATTAQWTSALRSVTYNRSYVATPSSGLKSINFLAIDGTPDNQSVRKTLVLVGGPEFAYPVLSWGVCENSPGTDIASLMGSSTLSNNKTMSWSVATPPLHGSVTLNGPQVTYDGSNFQPSVAKYTPDADYTGLDSVVFNVTDGVAISQMKLTLKMVPPPSPPGAIIGQDVDTVGPNPVRYFIEGPIDSSAAYHWTYSGSNVFIGGPYPSGDKVDLSFFPYPTATDGVLSVVATTTCGTSAASSKAITVRPIQFITFDSIPEKVYLYPDFGLSARTTSQLPVRFVITDTSVAQFTTDWTGSLLVHILNAGQTTITAFQDGQGGLQPATPVTRVLVVKKADQFISFLLPYMVTLGSDVVPPLNATASSGLPVQYESSNPHIAQIRGNQLILLDSGTVTITATQAGNNNYNPALPAPVTMIIVKPAQPPTVASVFPNPSHGSFYCQPEATFQAKSYALYNATGHRVGGSDQIIYRGSFEVYAGNVGPGIYFLKVFGKKNGKDATLKFRVLIL